MILNIEVSKVVINMYLAVKKSYASIFMLIGIGVYLFGVVIGFDRWCLLLGSTLFLVGAAYSAGGLTLGLFFIKPTKIKGSVCFFFGYFLLVLGWGMIGGLVQVAGIYYLFRDFIPQLYASAKYIPGIGPYICSSVFLKEFVAKVSGSTKVNTV